MRGGRARGGFRTRVQPAVSSKLRARSGEDGGKFVIGHSFEGTGLAGRICEQQGDESEIVLGLGGAQRCENVLAMRREIPAHARQQRRIDVLGLTNH